VRCATLRRAVAFAALGALAGAAARCGDSTPLPERDLALTVTAGDDVEFGRAFPLTVAREWSVDLTPEPWHDDALAPLRVVPLATTTRSDGKRTLETRNYRAYSFVAGRVALPAVPFHATDRAGATRSVASAPLAFDVKPSLADPASAAELPDELLLPPSPFTPARLAVASALLLAALLTAWAALRRRRRGVAPTPVNVPPPAVAPRVRALARLARLRASDPRDEPALAAFHVEAAALLKEYVAESHALPVLEWTTEEIATRADGPFEAADLARLLARCDRVKFARATSDPAARSAWIEGAARFVEATP
jgi:hypothetical protein